MADTYKKGKRLERQETILRFALDLNKELALRYSDDKDLVRAALAHVFAHIDRFHLRWMGLPRMTVQLRFE